MKTVSLMTVTDASTILCVMNHRLIWKLAESLGFPRYRVQMKLYLDHKDVLWISDNLHKYGSYKSPGDNWANRAATSWMRTIEQQVEREASNVIELARRAN